MGKQKIITFSGQARHGKDSSIEILKQLLKNNNKKVMHINYADFVKYLAKQYLNWNGSKDEQGRTILQQLGTEKVRTRFPNYWVDIVIGIAKIFENDYDYVLIGDCRFSNEIEAWEKEGYKVIPIHVERLNFDNGLTKEQKNHISETALNNYQFAEYIKADCLETLRKQIESKIIPLLARNKFEKINNFG